MILETERLSLTPLTVEDAPLVYPFMSDPEVMAHWDRAAIEDPDEVAAAVAAQVAEMDERRALYWAIRLTKTGRSWAIASWSTWTGATIAASWASSSPARAGARATPPRPPPPCWPTAPRPWASSG
jgi:RimJ/RimL family protein N-acetyltransferase